MRKTKIVVKIVIDKQVIEQWLSRFIQVKSNFLKKNHQIW